MDCPIPAPPHARELPKWTKQGPCHCVQRDRALRWHRIFHVFKLLNREPAIAQSLCVAFMACICLFIERDVRYVHAAERQNFTNTLPCKRGVACEGWPLGPHLKFDLLPIGKIGFAARSMVAWRLKSH